MKSFAILIALSASVSLAGFSQSKINFTQRMATPTYFFPEFAGWHGGLQTTLQYRNQWPGTSATNVMYNASVDGYSDKLHSGFSLNIGHERWSTGIINKNFAEINWSPKIVLANEMILMPALSGKLIQTHVDWAQYSATGNPISPITASLNSLSFGAGIGAVYKETFLIGHVHDINQPDQSFFPGSYGTLLRTYSIILGRNFSINKFTISPNISFHNQGIMNLLTFACNAQYKWMYVGAKYDFNGLAGAALGAEIKQRVRFSYSYDVTTSRLGTQSLGSHELAVRILMFRGKAKKQFLSNLPLM